MSNSPALLEVVREIYENERGVGFLEEDTHIVWSNPDPSPDLELGFQPLVLSESSEGEFDFVKATVYLGWSGDIVEFSNASRTSNDTYLRAFAEKMGRAYSQHDHQICIGAASELLAARKKRTALFKSRAALFGGEIIRM